MAAAGIYTARKIDDQWEVSAAIITRPARDASGEIRDRMPVFLEQDVWSDYLVPGKLDDTGKQHMVDLLTAESDKVAATNGSPAFRLAGSGRRPAGRRCGCC